MDNEPDIFPIMDFYFKNCHNEKIAGYLSENLSILDVGKLNSLEQAEQFISQNVNVL